MRTELVRKRILRLSAELHSVRVDINEAVSNITNYGGLGDSVVLVKGL